MCSLYLLLHTVTTPLRFTFIVLPCIFVHLVLSPTYALIYIIKILSQAIALIAISLLHVSIRTDHHQGVFQVLAKLLIKNYKIKSLKIFVCWAMRQHILCVWRVPHRPTYKNF